MSDRYDDLLRNREREDRSPQEHATDTRSEYSEGKDSGTPKTNTFSSMDFSIGNDSPPRPITTAAHTTPNLVTKTLSIPETTFLQAAPQPTPFTTNAFVFGAPPGNSPFTFGASTCGLDNVTENKTTFGNSASHSTPFTFGSSPATAPFAFGAQTFSFPAARQPADRQPSTAFIFGATTSPDQSGLLNGGNKAHPACSDVTAGGNGPVGSSMLSIRKANVPEYLHNSAFDRSLQDDEDGEISVPRDCMKWNDSVNNNEDLRSLLLTLRFWVAGCFCDPVRKYVEAHSSEAIEDTISEFYQDFPVLKYLKAVMTSKTPMVPAIESGELELVQYCLQRGSTWPALPCEKIATVGSVQMMKLALQAGCKLTQRVAELAAGHGHLDCLRFLHENGGVWNRGTITAAAEGGHLRCLQYAHQQGLPLSSKLYAYAVAADSLDIVKYLFESGVPWEDTKACETAAASGKIEFLKYMHENGCVWDTSVCTAAAKNHQLETVLYLLRTDCFPSGNIWDFTGDAFQQVLQCFLEVELPWSAASEAILRVVETGNLEGLASLADSGCPWHPATTTRLAQTNNLKMLMLAHEKGCPWNSNTCAQATSIELLIYAHTHGAPIPAGALNVMLEPAADKPRAVPCECVNYVHRHGDCPLDSLFTSCAARDGSLELLKYLYEQGCAWHPNAPVIATQYSHSDCLDYILSRGGPLTAPVLNMAMFSRSKACIDVIKKHSDRGRLHIVEDPLGAIRRRVLYLLRNGPPTDHSLWDITDQEFRHVVKTVLESGQSWSAFPDAMLHVIDAGNVAALKCLVENGCPWHPLTTSHIVETNNLAMLQYVHEHGCP